MLKMDHIGDFILSLASLAALRQACPDGHITLVCQKTVRGLAASTALFDEIVEFNFFSRDRGEPTAAHHVAYAAFRDVLAEEYDLAIDLRHDDDTRPLLDHIDARIRVGFQARNLVHPLDLSLPPLQDRRSNAEGRFVLHAETRLKLLMTATIDTFFPSPHSTLPGLAPGPRVPGLMIEGDYFVLAPGSGNTLKNWGADNFAGLGNRLIRDLGMTAVIVGGAADKVDATMITAALPEGRFVDLTDRLELVDLADLLRRARLFVGNDSGPAHLAASLDMPTVCIFSGVADLQVWHPRGANVHIVNAPQPCAPCYLHQEAKCPFARACITGVSMHMVLQGCEDVLRHDLSGRHSDLAEGGRR